MFFTVAGLYAAILLGGLTTITMLDRRIKRDAFSVAKITLNQEREELRARASAAVGILLACGVFAVGLHTHLPFLP